MTVSLDRPASHIAASYALERGFHARARRKRTMITSIAARQPCNESRPRASARASSMSRISTLRSWSTVLNADVVGYAAMMAIDEIAAIKALLANMSWLSRAVLGHRGRVIDAPGDNLLAEFSSEVAALDCALHVQRNARERNRGICTPFFGHISHRHSQWNAVPHRRQAVRRCGQHRSTLANSRHRRGGARFRRHRGTSRQLGRDRGTARALRLSAEEYPTPDHSV
jgi:hypothetical protein